MVSMENPERPASTRPNGAFARDRSAAANQAARRHYLSPISRVICALALLLFTLTESPLPGSAIPVATSIVLIYAACSIVFLVASLIDWVISFRYFAALIAFDVTIFFLLLAVYAVAGAAAVAWPIWLIAHIVFSGFVRWKANIASPWRYCSMPCGLPNSRCSTCRME